ncbi:MAG: hypothetical protein USCGTAYLOR_00169 [Chromatiales bacterium USCg_Taylor]|nr:MAG: hypothetical protein USCGTAYLOR_00169 [Chromatiales bacterium USCg_Taylor]
MVADIREFQPGELPGRMAGERGPIGRDAEKHGAPAVHAGFGAVLIIVGNDIKDFHPAFHAFLIGMGDGLGPLELLTAGQQAIAVVKGPAVILRRGKLHVVGVEVVGETQHGLDLVDVIAMSHKAQDHRVAVFLYGARHLDLVRERFRSRQIIIEILPARLETDLDMVQSGLAERFQARLIHAEPRGDKVGIKA